MRYEVDITVVVEADSPVEALKDVARIGEGLGKLLFHGPIAWTSVGEPRELVTEDGEPA